MRKGAEIDFCGEPALMQPGNPAFAGTNPNAAGKSPILRVNCVPPAPIKKPPALPQVVDCQLSGRLDSNQRPPAPKAGALTGLRYTPSVPSFRYCRRRCRLAAPFAFQNSQNRLLHYAAANRCRLLARRCRPSTVATGPSLPPALAGRASFGSPGCKDNGFFGAHQLFASKSFSGPKGHHRRRNRRRRGAPSSEGIAAEWPAARKPAESPHSRCRGGITPGGASPSNGPPPGSPQNRRTPAAAEASRPEGHHRRRNRPLSGIASGGASHFCSRPSKLPARRSCPLSRQPVEAARYRSGPSRLPAIAADCRTGG